MIKVNVIQTQINSPEIILNQCSIQSIIDYSNVKGNSVRILSTVRSIILKMKRIHGMKHFYIISEKVEMFILKKKKEKENLSLAFFSPE